MKTLPKFIILTLIILILTACAPKVVYVQQAPPMKQTEVIIVKPYPNAVWVEGHWQWHPRKHKYIWNKGYWTKPKHGKTWKHGRWEKKPSGWRRVQGRWE
jgi:hypothetical protein